jgi:hypothetical protein
LPVLREMLTCVVAKRASRGGSLQGGGRGGAVGAAVAWHMRERGVDGFK